MYGFTARLQTIETILKRYATHLQVCRDRIIADLQKSPRTAVRTGYFQQGKRFRTLLTFVAASAIGIEPYKWSNGIALELLHGASLRTTLSVLAAYAVDPFRNCMAQL